MRDFGHKLVPLLEDGIRVMIYAGELCVYVIRWDWGLCVEAAVCGGAGAKQGAASRRRGPHTLLPSRLHSIAPRLHQLHAARQVGHWRVVPCGALLLHTPFP